MKEKKVYISAKTTNANELEYIQKIQRASDMIAVIGFTPVTPVGLKLDFNPNDPEAIQKRLKHIEECDIIFMLSDWRTCDVAQTELEHFRNFNKSTKSFNILFEQENGYIKLSNYAQISQK